MSGPVSDILSPVTSLAQGLFGPGKIPTPATPKVAPIPDEAKQRAGMMRKMQRKYVGAGYEGTALSRGSTLG